MSLKDYLGYIKRYDWLLLMPALLLVLFGLASLYSGTLNVENPDWTFFNKQLTFFVIGLGLLVLASAIDYRRWRTYAMLLYSVAVGLMVAVLFWGETIRGTKGWFYILGFGLQPAELMKFVLVLALAYIYAKRKDKEREWTTVVLMAIVTLVPASLAILQPDFGSAIIILGIGLGFYGLVNMRAKHLLYILIGVVVMSVLLWNFILLDYQKERISTFINPMQDPLGKGYNVRQSIIAVGSGQLIGRGLGLGTQSQLQFLPETFTDFIFASIAETLGFLGTCLILLFFMVLFTRIVLIMQAARDNFSIYLVFGFGLIFFMQSVINLGMNMGILPVAGLSLPFVSYGGSFLIMCMLALGIIGSIRLRQKVV
jgi:rod shape determining protein RodA